MVRLTCVFGSRVERKGTTLIVTLLKMVLNSIEVEKKES